MNALFPLLTGCLAWPHPPSITAVWHPVYSYLLVTQVGRSILIDTGNPRSLIGQSRALPWFDAGIRMGPEDDLLSRLAGTGRSVSDIDLLVITHFDFDHCGNTDLFDHSGIECIVAAAQIDDAGLSDRYDRQLWDRPGIHFSEISDDAVVEPGVQLLQTTGHAPGHLSLLVELDDGPVLLAIDALYDNNALGEGPFPAFAIDHLDAWRRSRTKLLTIANETGAVLLFGHDQHQGQLLAQQTGPLRITPELRQSGLPVRSAT